LKDEPRLWKDFGELVRARNRVAHGGLKSLAYSPSHGIETARRVINWVEERSSVNQTIAN